MVALPWPIKTPSPANFRSRPYLCYRLYPMMEMLKGDVQGRPSPKAHQGHPNAVMSSMTLLGDRTASPSPDHDFASCINLFF